MTFDTHPTADALPRVSLTPPVTIYRKKKKMPSRIGWNIAPPNLRTGCIEQVLSSSITDLPRSCPAPHRDLLAAIPNCEPPPNRLTSSPGAPPRPPTWVHFVPGTPLTSEPEMANLETPARRDFIRDIVDEHMKSGRFDGRVHTRFPPEPNAYLHIGHAQAILLSYGIAQQYGGKFNLRFDDTNPTKEEQEFVDAIIDDVRWLGADWEDRLFYASDYFEQLYEWAVKLINKGKAYVCDLTAEQTREYRGTLTQPGRNSPYRDRSIGENLDLFARMRAGEFPDGSRTLRAKIDMGHPNVNMRDPVLYRILRARHHRTGDTWCIYPIVRLHPRAERFDRGHHALDLHARVREPPTAV